MKIAIIVVRLLMGLMFLFASLVVLFNLMPHPEMKGNAKLFMDGIMATGYFMTLLKITELVCGLAFVAGPLCAAGHRGDIPDHLEHPVLPRVCGTGRPAGGDTADAGKFVSGVCLSQ